MLPTLDQLRSKNADHLNNSNHWQLLQAMTDGGDAVDSSIKERLLVNVDNASQSTLGSRLKLAPYDNLIGSIIAKLSSQIMHTSMVISGSEDPYWHEWFENCAIVPKDENRVNPFKVFLSSSTLMALTQGKAIAQIDTRAVMANTRYEQEEKGGRNPYILLRNRWDLWDWETNNAGLTFAKLHSYRETKPYWYSDLVKEHEFTIYECGNQGVTASTYIVTIRPDAPNFPLERLEDKHVDIQIKKTEDGIELQDVKIFHTQDGQHRMPIAILYFPPPFDLASQLFDLQKSQFNQTVSLEWSLLQTAYTQLIFTGITNPHSGDNPAATQRAGDGCYWELEPGQDAKWLEKAGTGNEITMKYRASIKKAMLDVIETVAESAASDYALRMQSGDSKREGRRNRDILLEYIGQRVKAFAEDVLDICSIARGEDIDWEISGFCDYNSADFSEAMDAYSKLTADSGISSPTFRKALQMALIEKAGEIFSLDPEAVASIEKELDETPFSLNAEQRDTLVRVASQGYLHPYDLLETLKKAQVLPSDFEIDEAIARLEIGVPEIGVDPKALNAVAPLMAEPISEVVENSMEQIDAEVEAEDEAEEDESGLDSIDKAGSTS